MDISSLDGIDLLLIVGVIGCFVAAFFYPQISGFLRGQVQQQQQSAVSQQGVLEIPFWLIATGLIAIALGILTQFVNIWVVFFGAFLVMVIISIAVFIYQKEDVKTIQVSGQTADGSSATVKVQITVSRRATGIIEFLQLTLFDPSGDDFGNVVVASVNQTANTAIGQIPSDRFLRSAGEVATTIKTLLDANPDVLFRVHRIAVPEVQLPKAMVEALVQRATAVAGAQTVAITAETVIQRLIAGNIPVTESTAQVAIRALVQAQADVDRISAAGHSFGGFVEWLLQRFERVVKGGGNQSSP